MTDKGQSHASHKMKIRQYRPADREAVIAFWNAVFPDSTGHNDPASAIDRKLAVKDHLFFVVAEGDSIVGTVMAGYDGHRGWLYSLAVDPNYRRRGIAKRLVHYAEHVLGRLGCPKINLQIRGGNVGVVGFWESVGYQTEDRISMGKLISNAAAKRSRRVSEKANDIARRLRADFDVEAEQLAGTDSERIRREWLERFCANVKRNTGDWVCGDYRWHAYSFGHESALEGEVAYDFYRSREIEPFFAYFEFDDLLFDCTSSAWPDLRPLANDIYIFPHQMTWTFVTTHEMSMGLGPYFAQASVR